VSGATLHWSATAASHEYVESRTTGRTTTYVVVAGTTDTPPAVAGATVTYQVRPRYQLRKWSNAVAVTYSRGKGHHEGERERREREEREAKELAEREAKEKAEREAKEKAEREAKEKAELEAKEKAEREAKEKAEREQREREELEHKGGEEVSGAVVGKAPVGPPTPSSGWHIAYGDAFGAPLGAGAGQDNTEETAEKWEGCCHNSTEVSVEQRSQNRITPEGLQEVCEVGSFTVEGHTREASCGGVRSDTSPNHFEFSPALMGEWAVECVVRMPVDLGGADPGCWTYPSSSGELDFFELWGWNGATWATANGGMPVVVGQGEHEVFPVDTALGFDPSLAVHRYTTAFVPEGTGKYDVREYIDGTYRWDLPGRMLSSLFDGLIITNDLRHHVQPDVLTVRSVAVWEDGAHAGVGVKGGGIAPGTTVK
jgi:hypothetical protein